MRTTAPTLSFATRRRRAWACRTAFAVWFGATSIAPGFVSAAEPLPRYQPNIRTVPVQLVSSETFEAGTPTASSTAAATVNSQADHLPAEAGEPVLQLKNAKEQIKMVERFSQVLTLPDRIVRVDGFDESVVDITAIDSRSVRLFPRSPGFTTVALVDENDKQYLVDVLITGDVRHLQELLGRLFPTAAVEAIEVRESVILRGWVTQPDQITEIVEITEQFYPRVLNQMKVGCVQQVMMRVKIMEVQRSKLRQLGVNFTYVGNNGYGAITPGGLAPITSVSPNPGVPGIGIQSSALQNSNMLFGFVDPGSAFNMFVDALKQEAMLKILAEPDLVTMNGRPANLLSGGEIPVPVPQGLGNVTLQYKDYGTRLEAVPLILNNNRVRLEIFARVSDLDRANVVNLNGFQVPGILTRETNTQVELNFGETLVIAGLINSNKTGFTSKIPVIGDLPYVGALFRRTQFRETETELVITVTPELVAAMPPDQLPPRRPWLVYRRSDHP